MNIIGKLLKEALDSGKAVGYKTSVTDITGWLKTHSKAVGEELGNALGGKAKGINDKLIQGDVYDKLFTHMDDIAQQYPNATIQVAAKNAKKGGYKVAKLTVKNGDDTILNQAISVTNDGTIKSRKNFMGTEETISCDAQGMRGIQTSKAGTTKISYNAAQKTGQMELNYDGEQVAIVNYVNKGENTNRGGITYEVADDLVSGQMYYKGHEALLIGDTEGLKQWVKRGGTASGNKGESMPLTLKILRPLKERFNAAIDLFKYNGRKDYESLLSKNEMEKVLAELKSVKKVSFKDYEYLTQINDDIQAAEELIRITI